MTTLVLGIAIAAFALLVALLYVVGSLRGWWARRMTLEALIAKLEPAIRVYKPDGPGPFPAVLQVHGCGGAKAIQDDYAKAAQAEGAIAIVLDSLTPRGIDFETAVRTVCTGRRLRGRERAGDLVAGLEIVRRRPDVDAARIAVAGWSHGGWTIMDLMAMRTPKERPHNLKDMPDDPWRGVVAIELIYPFSGFPSLTPRRGWTKTDVPVDVLLVENDSIADENDSRKAFARARESGAQITVETWPGVTHAFEEDDHVEGSQLRYDPERAAAAHRRYALWVKRVLGL